MSGYGASRFDEMNSFGSNYSTPGWQRAQRTREERMGRGGFSEDGKPRYVPDGVFDDTAAEDDTDHLSRRAGRGRAGGAGEGAPPKSPARRQNPLTIEGELVAKSTGAASSFEVGTRVFHQKFGNGNVTAVDGNKLTIKFDHAGEKRVVDSFVERV
jgi:DNA helicase II / ATP-dependent DNA helicase PcrA